MHIVLHNKGLYRVTIGKVLSDKSTQSESSQISLVQVDLEQIKYIIQSTFQDQMEMQSSGYITYLKYPDPLLSLLIQAPKSSYLQLQNPVKNVETRKQHMCIQTYS